jgi:uncharacterized protein (TIRG00374 family)
MGRQAILLTQSFSLTRRRLVVLLALGLLSVALLLLLGGGRSALAALLHVDWRWLLLAVALHYSGFAVRGWRWQQILAGMGHRLAWWYATALLVGGWFVSALLPARAGDVMRVGVLWKPPPGRPQVPLAAAVSSLILERALDLMAILTLGAGFAFLAARAQLPAWVTGAYVVGTAGLLLLAGTLLVAPALLERLRTWWSNPWWIKGLDFAAQLVTSLRGLARQPGRAAWLISASLYIWLCDALLMWLVVRSLGELLAFNVAAFVALTVDVFATVPLTPGGVGQIEAVNAALLALLQLPEARVAAAVLVNRAISYWTFLIFSGAVMVLAGLRPALDPTNDEAALEVNPGGTPLLP